MMRSSCGVAGSGKSAFTLKLCAALRDEGLRPIRIRMRDLSLDPRMPLLEDVAQALVQNSGDEDFDRDNSSRPAAAEIDLSYLLEESVPFGQAIIAPHVRLGRNQHLVKRRVPDTHRKDA
jgi:hypothetical protein